MRYLLLLVCLSAPPLVAQQDHTDVPQQSPASERARFLVIQSQIAAKFTFKLDRYTGTVSQFVHDAQGNNYWQKMDILPGPNVKVADHPRFQIFTSNIAARFTFLIDNDSGTTWQLVENTVKNADGTEATIHAWQLLEQQ